MNNFVVFNRALDDLNATSAQNMVKELAHKKAEKEQDKMIREMLKARKHLRDEVKAVIDESNAKERDAEFQDFHRRHDLRLAEINVRGVVYCICTIIVTIHCFVG